MNTKMIFVSLTLTLATSASAQTVEYAGPRGSINIGSPIVLVGPSALGACPKIEMASLPLTPAFSPVFAPVPMGPALPMLPVNPIIPHMPVMPMPAPVMPGRRAPAMPIVTAVAPARAALSAVKLSAPANESAPAKDVIAAREKLDKVFDGRTPSEREDERGPVRSSRHVSLPENDLEKEIGAY